MRVDLAPPRRAPAAQAFGQAGDDAHDERGRPSLAMEERAEGLPKVAAPGEAQQVPPGAPRGMTVSAEIAPPTQPREAQSGLGQQCVEGST
jgi:hypothetical protein